jgi:hypothetical protein
MSLEVSDRAVQCTEVITPPVSEHRALKADIGTGKWQPRHLCPTYQLADIIKLLCNIQDVLGSFVQEQSGQAGSQAL